MSTKRALELLESVSDNNVLFVGDSIVDEYHYVHGLGRSPKEHLIPVAYEEEEVFSGGVTAAAAHVDELVQSVVVASGLPIRKVRFVEKLYNRKLFEVHYGSQGSMCTLPDVSLYDIVVVTDFGHGAITSEHIHQLVKAKFLAVNAQTNSANMGFNLITKYPCADYIVIDEPEARLAAADRDSSIQDVILKLATDRCNKFVVTRGSKGAVGWDGKDFYSQLAFTDRVVDTMGAGDAFFAVTAVLASKGSMEDLLLIGNAAGALKTQIVGHRYPITKEMLVGYLKDHPRG